MDDFVIIFRNDNNVLDWGRVSAGSLSEARRQGRKFGTVQLLFPMSDLKDILHGIDPQSGRVDADVFNFIHDISSSIKPMVIRISSSVNSDHISKAVNTVKQFLDNVGAWYEHHRSKKSGSEYFLVEHPDDRLSPEVDVRVSDHNLPYMYDQPDLDVDPDLPARSGSYSVPEALGLLEGFFDGDYVNIIEGEPIVSSQRFYTPLYSGRRQPIMSQLVEATPERFNAIKESQPDVWELLHTRASKDIMKPYRFLVNGYDENLTLAGIIKYRWGKLRKTFFSEDDVGDVCGFLSYNDSGECIEDIVIFSLKGGVGFGRDLDAFMDSCVKQKDVVWEAHKDNPAIRSYERERKRYGANKPVPSKEDPSLLVFTIKKGSIPVSSSFGAGFDDILLSSSSHSSPILGIHFKSTCKNKYLSGKGLGCDCSLASSRYSVKYENKSLHGKDNRFKIPAIGSGLIESATIQDILNENDKNPEFTHREDHLAATKAQGDSEITRTYASTVEMRTKSEHFQENKTYYRQWILLKDFCFTAGTPVWTKRGLIPIESVLEGDEVLTHTGGWGVVESTGSRVVEETVIIKRGQQSFRCTPEHPFYVKHKFHSSYHNYDEKVGFLPASEFDTSTGVIAPFRKFGSVYISEALAFLCGLYLADGNVCACLAGKTFHRSGVIFGDWNIQNITITGHERSLGVLTKALSAWSVPFSCYMYKKDPYFGLVITDEGWVKAVVSRCGFNWKRASGGKTFPMEAYDWDEVSCRHFLAGFFFGDGSGSADSRVTVSFYNSNKSLIDGIAILLRGWFRIAYVSSNKAFLKGKRYKDSHSVTLSGKDATSFLHWFPSLFSASKPSWVPSALNLCAGSYYRNRIPEGIVVKSPHDYFPLRVQESVRVFNLQISGDNSFLVGESGFAVHNCTIAKDKKIKFEDSVDYAINFCDVSIRCSCPSFLYHGFSYMGDQLGYLYGIPREKRFPKKNNPNLKLASCKHCDIALEHLLKNKENIIKMFGHYYKRLEETPPDTMIAIPSSVVREKKEESLDDFLAGFDEDGNELPSQVKEEKVEEDQVEIISSTDPATGVIEVDTKLAEGKLPPEEQFKYAGEEDKPVDEETVENVADSVSDEEVEEIATQIDEADTFSSYTPLYSGIRNAIFSMADQVLAKLSVQLTTYFWGISKKVLERFQGGKINFVSDGGSFWETYDSQEVLLLSVGVRKSDGVYVYKYREGSGKLISGYTSDLMILKGLIPKVGV